MTDASQGQQDVPQQNNTFFHQKGWILLGGIMVVVGSWPGWLPFLLPQESASYVQKLLPTQLPSSFQDQGMQTRLAQLEATLHQIEARAPAPFQGEGENTLTHDLATAYVRTMGWMSLRSKLLSGQPFAREAVLLTPFVNDQARQDLLTLDPFAPTGVPTLQDLKTSLNDLIADQKAQEIEKQAQAERPFFERAWDHVLTTLKSLIRITTDTPQSISGAPLAATKDLLDQGKLNDAIALWDQYGAKAKAPLPDKVTLWLQAAKTRAKITPMVTRIQEHMVDLPQLERVVSLLKKENPSAS